MSHKFMGMLSLRFHLLVLSAMMITVGCGRAPGRTIPVRTGPPQMAHPPVDKRSGEPFHQKNDTKWLVFVQHQHAHPGTNPGTYIGMYKDYDPTKGGTVPPEMTVTNPEEFLTTVQQGIGPAKGFGFGLLSLARAEG